MRRALVIVLDSFGVGESKDASKFDSQGANTFLNIAKHCAKGKCEIDRSGKLSLPFLQSLGLNETCHLSCGEYAPLKNEVIANQGAWGYAVEQSSAKDTTSGHWEMMGLPVFYEWGYFEDIEDSFPENFVEQFVTQANLKGILGNCRSSGIKVIQEFGEEHLRTGKPICYTSADSVFQIAYHESIWSPEQAKKICSIARELLNEYKIARVIARPFIGDSKKNFTRTSNRRDYSMPAHAETLLDKLTQVDIKVTAVGKIFDIFAQRGISEYRKASGLSELMTETLNAWKKAKEDVLIFTNLVDFDTLYGHQRDVNGYAKELEDFDAKLAALLPLVNDDDLLIITADHGCDPTYKGTDHTREHVPVLIKGKGLRGSIGERKTFADIGESLAEFFSIERLDYGSSFLSDQSL